VATPKKKKECSASKQWELLTKNGLKVRVALFNMAKNWVT